MIARGEPRLLALDLDGTLLGPDGEVSPRTRVAVERLRAGGVHVVLASGRAPAGMRRLCQELGLDDPQITMQGALIASPLTGSVLAAWQLEPAEARAHIAFARQAGAVPLLCFADGFRGEILTPEVEALFAPFEEPLPLVVPDLERLVEERPLKTFLYTPPGTYERIWTPPAARLPAARPLLRATSIRSSCSPATRARERLCGRWLPISGSRWPRLLRSATPATTSRCSVWRVGQRRWPMPGPRYVKRRTWSSRATAKRVSSWPSSGSIRALRRSPRRLLP